MQVATHSTPSDCWVSLLGRVLDLTPLLVVRKSRLAKSYSSCLTLTPSAPEPQENPGPLAQPIIKAAGTDISHWFDPETCDVKTYVKPETNIRCPYLPMVRA